MIRKFSLGCKLIRVKNSSASFFRRQISGLSPENEICPFCGGHGSCASFSSYKRYVVDFIDGAPRTETIRVPRVRCRSCKRTHGILTDLLIPYRSYSLFFVLRVIGEYLLHLTTVEGLCLRFEITTSMLYRWFGIFKAHKAEWLGFLQDQEQSALDFLKDLVSIPEYASFSYSFYDRTLLSFLQSHANPANCRYRPGRHA